VDQAKEPSEQIAIARLVAVFIAVVLLSLFTVVLPFLFTVVLPSLFTVPDLFIAELLRGFLPPIGKFAEKLHLTDLVECSVLALAVNSDFLEVLFVVDLAHGKVRALDERSYRQAAGIFADSVEDHRRYAVGDIFEWHRTLIFIVGLGNILLGKIVLGNVVVDNAVLGDDVLGDCTPC